MRAPLLLALALAGCLAPHAPPEAVVHAGATSTLEGASDLAAAREAAQTLGYAIEGGGAFGFATATREGHTLFVQAPDGTRDALLVSVAFRIERADVCATPTYDAWVEATLARLAPVAQEAVDALAESLAARAAPLAWDVLASDGEGDFLRFPAHCGRTVACLDHARCDTGATWQERAVAPPER